MKPKVSIIIATYNRAHLLPRAIESVLSQSFQDWEMIIIDDNSKDSTESVVKKYLSDSRIRFIQHSQNMHIMQTRKEGVNEAQGEYIAMLDDDDIWDDTEKLKKQTEFLENNKDYNLIGTNAHAVDEKGNALFVIRYPLLDRDIRKKILIKNCFINSSVLFRKHSALECGLYEESEKYVEDYGLWLRMGREGKLRNLPDLSVKYRVNFSGITQTNTLNQIKNSYLVIKKNKEYYPGFFLGYLKWKTKLILKSVLS